MNLFRRLRRLVSGLAGLLITSVEQQNPEALLDAAKQDFLAKVAQYNQALVQLASVAERIKNHLQSKTSRAAELERRILANHKAGNIELAGSLARELQDIQKDIEQSAQELKDTEAAYENNIANAKLARKDFDGKVQRFERQISRVKMKEAEAEAAAALNGVTFRAGDTGDILRNIQEILDRRYERAAGKARVTADLIDSGHIAEQETERKALEQQALAGFLTERGL